MEKTSQIRKISKGRNQRGFAMVEAILVVVGVGVMAMASISLQDTLLRNQARVSIHSQLGEMRRLLLETLNNSTVWDQIVKDPRNGIAPCMIGAEGTCSYLPPQRIAAEISAASNLSIDPSNENLGFDMALEGCSSFGSQNGNSMSCPFRAEMTWKPVCTVAGECKQMEVTVEVKANSEFENLYSFAAKSYSFTLKKNMELKNTETDPNARTYSFVADADAPKSVKVFMIMDNSSSMTDDREMLGKGLESFIDGMKGYDVEYFVYTTESAAYAKTWIFPEAANFTSTSALEATGAFTLPNGTTFASPYSWSVVAGQKFTKWVGNYQLAPDMGKRLGLVLKQSKDQTDFSALKATMKQLLVQIESTTETGVPEAGLCTLAHILYDTGKNKTLQEGDSAIFMTLSDEDDNLGDIMATEPLGQICPGKVEVKPQSASDVHRQGCWHGKPDCMDGLRFWFSKPTVQKKTMDVRWRMIDQIWNEERDLCTTKTPGGCGTVGLKQNCTLADVPGGEPAGGWKFDGSCTTNVIESTPGTYKAIDVVDLDGGVIKTEKNYCTEKFFYKGVQYNGGLDMLVKTGMVKASEINTTNPNCELEGERFEPEHATHWAILNSSQEPTTILDEDEKYYDAPTRSLYKNIPTRLRELFGADGYGLYYVIHDAAVDSKAGCTMDPGAASYGTKYKEVLMASDTPGNLTSVCSDNYSSSVENMRVQAQQIARDTYALTDFNPDIERVYSISVQRNNSPVMVTKSDYGVAGSNLQFKAGFIQGLDKIQVVIVPK